MVWQRILILNIVIFLQEKYVVSIAPLVAGVIEIFDFFLLFILCIILKKSTWKYIIYTNEN